MQVGAEALAPLQIQLYDYDSATASELIGSCSVEERMLARLCFAANGFRMAGYAQIVDDGGQPVLGIKGLLRLILYAKCQTLSPKP